LLCRIRKRGCHARLKLRGRFGVSVLPNLVLASGNEECLHGTKAALLDSGAYLLPQLGGRVSKIARKALFIHETPPFREWYRSGTTFGSKWYQANRKKCKQLSRKYPTNWPQPFMFQYPCLSPMIRLHFMHAAPIAVEEC